MELWGRMAMRRMRLALVRFARRARSRKVAAALAAVAVAAALAAVLAAALADGSSPRTADTAPEAHARPGSAAGRRSAPPPGSRSALPPRVRTVYTVDDVLHAFAQDGNRIVVANAFAGTGDGTCGRTVLLLDLSTGRTSPLAGPSKTSVTCVLAEFGSFQPRMALAGARALWVIGTGGNSTAGWDVFTGAPRTGERRIVGTEFGHELDDPPVDPIELAGDGQTLVFVSPPGREGETPSATAGFTTTITLDGRTRVLAGSDGTTAVAAFGSWFAFARFATESGQARYPVEVRATATNALIARFDAGESVSELALTGNAVALVVVGPLSDPTARIDVRRLDGTLIKRFAVPLEAEDMAMGGRWVVFRVGRRIRAIDTRTGRRSLLALAPQSEAGEHPIVGLSVEGARVVWGEPGTGRIRAVSLRDVK